MDDSGVFSGTAGLPEDLRRKDETLEPLLVDRGYILQKREGYRFSCEKELALDFERLYVYAIRRRT